MKDNIDITKLIDSRNKDIFEKVQSKFELTFIQTPNGEHSIYTRENQITFLVPLNASVDTFSHELLHAYMSYHEVYIGGNFRIIISKSNNLSTLLDLELSDHITNCIEHTLMLPMFLERGFDRSKFLFDYYYFKAEPGFIKQIGKSYKQGSQYNISAIRNFIGKFFAFKCDPNPDFDYTSALSNLKKIDPQLYMILEQYFFQWNSYDFTNDTYGEFRGRNAFLYDSMKPWLNGKRFVK